MLQRLLDTAQLTGAQWALVLALSLVAPAFTAIDKAIQLRRLKLNQPRRRNRALGDGLADGTTVPVQLVVVDGTREKRPVTVFSQPA